MHDASHTLCSFELRMQWSNRSISALFVSFGWCWHC